MYSFGDFLEVGFEGCSFIECDTKENGGQYRFDFLAKNVEIYFLYFCVDLVNTSSWDLLALILTCHFEHHFSRSSRDF